MQKSIYLFALLLLFSCQNEPPAEQEANEPTSASPTLGQAGNNNRPTRGTGEKSLAEGDLSQSDATIIGESDQNSILEDEATNKKMLNGILEGSWESLTETLITIKFEKGKMGRYKDSSLELEEDYKLDLKCTDAPCDSAKGPFALCIVTSSNCYSITKLDLTNLLFTSGSDQVKHHLLRISE